MEVGCSRSCGTSTSTSTTVRCCTRSETCGTGTFRRDAAATRRSFNHSVNDCPSRDPSNGCPPLQQDMMVNESLGGDLEFNQFNLSTALAHRNMTGNSTILFSNCSCPRNRTEGSTCRCPAPELGSFSYVAQYCEGLLPRTPITTCTNSACVLEDVTSSQHGKRVRACWNPPVCMSRWGWQSSENWLRECGCRPPASTCLGHR